jgi:hypothetical protein
MVMKLSKPKKEPRMVFGISVALLVIGLTCVWLGNWPELTHDTARHRVAALARRSLFAYRGR